MGASPDGRALSRMLSSGWAWIQSTVRVDLANRDIASLAVRAVCDVTIIEQADVRSRS